MNILELNWNLGVGGQQRHVVDLSNFLVSKGHNVFLLSQGGVLQRDLDERVVHVKIPFNKFFPKFFKKILNPFNLLLYISIRRKYLKLLSEKKIDVIHCHGVAEAYFCLKNKRSAPIICSSHGYLDDTWKWHTKIIKNADYFIGVSNFTTQKLNKYISKKAKTETINYGIAKKDLTYYPNNIREITLKNVFKGQNINDFKVVVTVARLSYQKGYDILLKAIPKLLKNEPKLRFIFVGSGDCEFELKQLAKNLDVENQIAFVGMQQDVYPFLLAGDVFCLPSRYEGLPLSIVEAYRSGLPVVVSNASGNPEIVKIDKTGYVFLSENVEDLTDKLLKVIEDEKKLIILKRNAQEYGNDSFFDPEYVHTRIENFYKSILLGKHG